MVKKILTDHFCSKTFSQNFLKICGLRNVHLDHKRHQVVLKIHRVKYQSFKVSMVSVSL